MIKRNQQFFNALNMLADVALAFGLCRFLLPEGGWIPPAVYAFCFWLALALQGFYNSDRLYRLRERAARILAAALCAMLLLSLLYFQSVSERQIVLLLAVFLLSLLIVTAKYVCMRLLLNALRASGRNIKHVIVVGTGPSALAYARDVARLQHLGYHVLGFVGGEADGLPAPLLCGFDGLEELLHNTVADEAVIALTPEEATLTRELVLVCDRNGIRYSLIPSESGLLSAHTELDYVGGSKLLSPRMGPLDNVGWAALKRMSDLILSLVGIVLLSPLMAAVAVGVRLSGPGPVLFRQERVGYNRKPFQMLKFRSMRPNEDRDTAWTGTDDPRRTRFGAWIRKLSLDELPQLFNVLTGSMSLVGPRPELPFFVEQYRKTIPLYMLKHQVRPGMTGWAQVNGLRGDTSIEDRIAHDLWYIEHWTPWLDLRILFRTLFGGMVNQENVSSTGWTRLRKRYRELVLPAAAYASTLFFIGYTICQCMVSKDLLLRFHWVYELGLVCCCLVVLGVLFEKKSVPLRLLLLNLVWLALTRFLRGEYHLMSSSVFCSALSGCACFIGGSSLKRRQGELLWKLAVLELAVIMTAWALPGICAALLGHSVFGIERIALDVEYTEPPLVFLRFFGVHRNLTATYFVCAAGMLLVCCLESGKRLWKLLLALLLPLWYLAVSLQHSRSTYLTFALLITFSLAALLLKKGKMTTPIGKALGACALALCLVVSYKSFAACSNGLMTMSEKLREPAVLPVSDQAESVPDAQEALIVTDSRSTLQDVPTLTGRTEIWAAAIPALRKHPKVLLVGQAEGKAMKIINAELTVSRSHMHNVLMQQLVIAGVPGVLLYAAFLLYLLWHAAESFRRRGGKDGTVRMILAGLLISLMAYGMLEPLLSPRTPVVTILFLLIAGYFTRCLPQEYGKAPIS